MNIDLSEYKLVRPESIKKIIDNPRKFIDIEVEDDHTFFICGENNLILSHNCDGNSIAGLLINFLHKFWPELFEHSMVFKAETPIVVCYNQKQKKKIPFYTQSDYNNWLEKVNPKEWEIKYKKGLAALVDDEYKEIIHNPRLTKLKLDNNTSDSLKIWFGKESEPRKIEILK